MKIFGIVGTLMAVAIIGFMAALYFNTVTSPVTSAPAVITPYGTVGGSSSTSNVIDTARGLVSMDRERQHEMQNMLNRIGGANITP